MFVKMKSKLEKKLILMILMQILKEVNFVK